MTMQPGYRLSEVDGNPEDVRDANFQVDNIKNILLSASSTPRESAVSVETNLMIFVHSLLYVKQLKFISYSWVLKCKAINSNWIQLINQIITK